jgi:hypothetical protein
LGLAIVAAAGCKDKNRESRKTQIVQDKTPVEEPPLLLEDPLLLPQANNGRQDLPEGPVADNSRCHVCHINYSEEELAVSHARANVGCEQCHGASDAHCSDEDNVTPPDKMYPLEEINSSCMTCHSRQTIETQMHEEILSGAATDKKYCTDCHGAHRLGYRTRRWNKSTGELIEDDNVRMMSDEMLEQK